MSRYSKLSAVIDFILDDEAEEKLKALFELFDLDGNGKIQRDELKSVLAICAHEVSLDVDDYLEQIVDAIFSSTELKETNVNKNFARQVVSPKQNANGLNQIIDLSDDQTKVDDATPNEITLDGLRNVLRYRPNLADELSLMSKKVKQSNNETSSGYKNNNLRSNSKQNRYAAKNNPATTDKIIDKWESILDLVTDKAPGLNKLRWDYLCNNYVTILFTLCLFITSICLYVSRIFSYWGNCGFVIIARASGQCLNFLSAIIILLVCRRSISYLRTRGWGKYLPVDDHVYFHKMTGWMIVIHTLLHTFGHIMNFYMLSSKQDSEHTWTEYAFSTKLNIGWFHGTASITGWLLLIIVFIMALAQPFSRRYGKFELFYYTHLLFVPFWCLLFIHAPNFWIWFLVPLVIFTIETILRVRNLIRFVIYEKDSTIIRGVPLPSNVLYLVIKRPLDFDYKPGDWVYVLIPEIAKYEWHPFTISSAPEQEGVITLHIRAVGEWTKTLRNYFVENNNSSQRDRLTRFIKSGQFSMSIDNRFCTTIDLNESDSTVIFSKKVRGKLSPRPATTITGPLPAIPEDRQVEETELAEIPSANIQNQKLGLNSQGQATKNRLARQDADEQRVFEIDRATANVVSNLKIYVDGPYSSPASQIFRSEHAILIATGIGVTPFASILQSIVYHNEKRRQICPSCTCEFVDSRRPIVNKLRKVDFVWINRDQKSFEWFIKLLADLEFSQSQLEPHERFLDIHIHLTAIEKTKIKSVGMQLALYLMHEKNKKDLVTGLRTRTKAGRPNWDEFFSDIQDQKRGKVSVFFCGRPQLGRQLHRHCDKFGFKFRKEIF